MNTTPPPMPNPVVIDHDIRSGIIVRGYTLKQIKARDAQWMERITALDAEIEALRFELQTARDVNLAVVNRQQAEIADLKKKLHTARKDEADALWDRDRVYEAQERADDAYRAGSSGY